MIESGFSEERIEEQKQCVCPFRGTPFKKEDLEYAFIFANKAIKKFRQIKDRLEIDQETDPVLMNGIQLY